MPAPEKKIRISNSLPCLSLYRPWIGLQWNQSHALCVLAMTICRSIFIIWGYIIHFYQFRNQWFLIFFSLLILLPEIFRSGYWNSWAPHFKTIPTRNKNQHLLWPHENWFEARCVCVLSGGIAGLDQWPCYHAITSNMEEMVILDSLTLWNWAKFKTSLCLLPIRRFLILPK